MKYITVQAFVNMNDLCFLNRAFTFNVGTFHIGQCNLDAYAYNHFSADIVAGIHIKLLHLRHVLCPNYLTLSLLILQSHLQFIAKFLS